MDKVFLGDQGYGIGASKLYQDNISSMLLEENEKALSGKRTIHINIH